MGCIFCRRGVGRPILELHTTIQPTALRKLASWLAGHDGVVAIMTNGHTGEVFSLTPSERAEVTRIVADELRGRMPVISSIVCEGLAEAAEHARAAQAAGAARWMASKYCSAWPGVKPKRSQWCGGITSSATAPAAWAARALSLIHI